MKSCKTLLYAPTLYAGDVSGFNIISDSAYYLWQSMLWNFLETKKDWDFIWKGIPRSCHVEDPFQNKKAKNIRYSSNSLKSEFGNADKILLDFPSTPLYEAITAEKEILCFSLFGSEFIRSNVRDRVSIPKDPDQALSFIDHFLNDRYKIKQKSKLKKNNIDWKKIVM